MKTRSNMPLFVVECDNVKTLSNAQIDLLRCGDYLVKKDESGEHAYKVTFKSDTGLCLTYHDASVIETQSYDKIDGVWTYNSEDKTELGGGGTKLYLHTLEFSNGDIVYIINYDLSPIPIDTSDLSNIPDVIEMSLKTTYYDDIEGYQMLVISSYMADEDVEFAVFDRMSLAFQEKEKTVSNFEDITDVVTKL